MLGIEIIAQTGDFGGWLRLYLSIAESSENRPCNLILTFIECLFLLGTLILSICYTIGLFFKLLTVSKVKSKI